LNLTNNRLISIPSSIGNLNSLEYLNLENNQLTKLPDTIGNLKSLRQLYLYKNHLITVPDTIGTLEKLKILDLSKNNLKSPPRGLENLKFLNILNLEKNPLNTLSYLTLDLLYKVKVSYDINCLSSKGKTLYYRKRNEELFEYYRKSPNQLASEYIINPKSLNEDELERLIHEAGKNEIRILENGLPADNPILRKIMAKFSLELSSGYKLFL